MKGERVNSEPEYVRQSGEPMTDDEARQWLQTVADEARAEGVTFARWSIHPDIPNLRIFEGWRVRPEDQGEIRWALTLAAPETQSGVPKRPRPLADVPPSQAVCSAPDEPNQGSGEIGVTDER